MGLGSGCQARTGTLEAAQDSRQNQLKTHGAEDLAACESVGAAREVQGGKFAMVLQGGSVVGFGGVCFRAEGPEGVGLAVGADGGVPALRLALVRNAFVLRGTLLVGVFESVTGVLGRRGRTQVGAAIVVAVVVDVIDDESRGHGQDVTMHGAVTGLAIRGADTAGGVEGSAAVPDVPFVLGETFMVGGIDDGVLALGQGDAAEGVAVTESPIDQRQSDADAGEPKRDGYGYGDGRTPIRVDQRSKCNEQNGRGPVDTVLDSLGLLLTCFRMIHLCGPIMVALYYWGDVACLIRKKRNSNSRLNL
jgi:hypothetical protein